MLTLEIPETEYYDENSEEFVTVKAQTLNLEHSLISVSKWESKWKKPFLSDEQRTYAETIDYIACMSLTHIDRRVLLAITPEHIRKINEYIDDTMTATWFKKQPKSPPSKEVITSEIIYYDMIALQIPFECQKWHLNRLLTLIRVCQIKNTPKKMSKRDIMKQNKSLNAARRSKFNTSG